MNIYAVRGNGYEAIYTNKVLLTYIIRKYKSCSHRKFDVSEVEEAREWIGVKDKEINEVPKKLERDTRFIELLNQIKGSTKELVVVEPTAHASVNSDVVGMNSLIEEDEKFLRRVLRDVGNDVNIFVLRTKSFGDIYMLKDMWICEEDNSDNLKLSLRERIDIGYIKYNLDTTVEYNPEYIKISNAYKKKCEYEEGIDAEDLLELDDITYYLKHDEIRGVVPVNNVNMMWEYEGDRQKFVRDKNKSSLIKEALNIN